MSADSPVVILYDSDGANPVGTPTHPLRVDPTGSTAQPVSATSLPLPSGAATSTIQTDGTQKTQVTSLPALSAGTNTIGKVDQGTGGASAWKVDGSAVTQPVSAASLPLPTGASTSALQTQPGVDIGDVTVNNAAGAAAVNIQDGGNSITVDATALPLPAGASTSALQTTGNSSLSSIDTKTPALGQAAMAGSTPVVIANNQTAVPVSMAAGGYGGQVEGRAADGAAPVGNPVLVGGSDGTLAQTLLTDSLGRLIIAPAGAAGTAKGFVNGEVVLAATTVAPIRKTTYTEPAANAQRSIASASANDSSAGTGARQVRIIYYTTAGVGPLTETITMNGTTAVNTVATDIRFIEKLEVISVGSGGVNAGIVTLYGSTGAGGGTVWSIAATDNRTFGAHHYVATGQKCNVTGLLIGIKGADTTSGFLRAKDPTVATSPENQISDTIRAPSSGQSFRSYGTPIVVTGPARITVFVAPDSTSSRTYYGSFDFYEEAA